MKIAELDRYVNSEPIWKYERDEGTFLVRVRCKSNDGSNNFIIKSPNGKLYSFCDYDGSEESAICEIINKKADNKKRYCFFESIYEK